MTKTVERAEAEERQRMRRGLFVEEVILENFMSHRYSRIPFRPGLNVISGPNGSGKSSILLGLSVALGQTYTERAEKLSGLIRRGSEVARVSVVLDNSPIEGKRPIPSANLDKVVIARYLKKSGEYWHYVNNRFMPKAEVEHLLGRLGINPNNMLIIMHQNMVEQFGARSSQEKLSMVEEAVGAGQLRGRILEAEDKLTELQSEEEAVRRSLEEAKAAVEFWREEYEKLLTARKLHDQKNELEREHAWSIVVQLEKHLQRLAGKITQGMAELKRLEERTAKAEDAVAEQREKFKTFLATLRRHYFSMVETKKAAASGAQTASGEGGKMGKIDAKISRTEERLVKAVDTLVEKSVRLALLKHRMKAIGRELRKLRSEFDELDKELGEKIVEAEEKGSRVDTERKPVEVLEDIRVVSVQIASMGHVSKQADDMYLMADAKYKETEVKFQVVVANIRRALEEVKHRKEVWRQFLRDLIRDVEPSYNRILSLVDAQGRLALENLEDVREASLDLYVGFRGVEPSMLNAHTQSGGERTVSTMSFLLALQRHVKSSFRAVDEFDVHMDPQNRERMIKILTSSVQDDFDVQYIVITPGKVQVEGNPHIVIVQNVGGTSEVKAAGG